ncbi:hypothetical protein PT974_00083 [Cladobotryum mycophilum]|uniref:RNase III domain-containing protein n=1 Tax=Cladobotryum mycophilum TaxID=491253 RepID=A0ABR0T0R5_9HYPO
MPDQHEIQNILAYEFRDFELVSEAFQAPGAGQSLSRDNARRHGNKGLAQIGDAVLRLVIIDDGIMEGASTKQCHDTHEAEASNAALEQKMKEWDIAPILPPPSLLATLVTALHARPLQLLPLTLFTPTLLFSSYLNLSGYPTASAGLTAAWSGLYALLAFRRRQTLRNKFTIRGAVRGSAIGLGAANSVAGGWVYFHGSAEKDRQQRIERNRWGQFNE